MKKWTQKEVEYLKDNPSQTNVEIGKALKRTEDSIYRKRRRLGLLTPKKVKEITKITPESVKQDVIEIVTKREESVNARKLRVLAQELIKTEKERDAFLSVGRAEAYTIKPSGKRSIKSEATAIALLSDVHYEEPVKRSQVNGLNEYSTAIAKSRVEEYFIVLAQLVNEHQLSYEIDHLVLGLLGDFISGSIHEDLTEANTIQPTQAIYEIQTILASGIKYLLKNTNVKITLPCSAGNHSRITAKQRMATEYGNSLEILMYCNLRDLFAGEERINFIINDAYLTIVSVYDYKCRFHHGTSIRYLGGVGGLFIPAFKAIMKWNEGRSNHVDFDFFGHLHQLKYGGNFVSNGSVIGYGAYAIRGKFGFEEPKQAFMILDRKRGLDVIRQICLT